MGRRTDTSALPSWLGQARGQCVSASVRLSPFVFFLCGSSSVNSFSLPVSLHLTISVSLLLSLLRLPLFCLLLRKPVVSKAGPATGNDRPSWVWPEALPWLRALSGWCQTHISIEGQLIFIQGLPNVPGSGWAEPVSEQSCQSARLLYRSSDFRRNAHPLSAQPTPPGPRPWLLSPQMCRALGTICPPPPHPTLPPPPPRQQIRSQVTVGQARVGTGGLLEVSHLLSKWHSLIFGVPNTGRAGSPLNGRGSSMRMGPGESG